MTTLSFFYLLTGLFAGFVLRLCAEHIQETIDTRKGHAWPIVKGYEQNQSLYDKHSRACIGFSADGESYQELGDISFEMIDKEKFQKAQQNGLKAKYLH